MSNRCTYAFDVMRFEHWLYTVPLRLRSLFRSHRVEQELDDELRYHIERLTEAHIANGLTPEDARRAALRAMDGVAQHKEQCRDVRRVRLADDFVKDLRYAVRLLRRSPGFASVAILSLALGIGANTAMFAIVDALLLRLLPVQRPHELFFIKRNEDTVRSFGFRVRPDVETYTALTAAFSGVSAIVDVDRSNATIGGRGADPGINDPSQVRVSLVSGNYFSTLGVNASAGRTLTPDDGRVAGAQPVAVISHGYWTRAFVQDPGVVGRTIALNGVTYAVVGVTPPRFSGEWVGRAVDVWLPLTLAGPVTFAPPGAGISVHRVIVRLKPGVTPAQAQAALDVVAPPMAQQYLAANPQLPAWAIQLARLRVVLEGAARGFSPQRDSFGQPVLILMMMVSVVLASACANVAGLLLARATGRHREMSVRLALGAGRARIVRQLLTESLLLASLGGALGVLFSLWATDALVRFVGSAPMGMVGLSAMSLDVRPDGRMLIFTASVCLTAGTLFGLAPAFRSSGAPLSAALTARAGDAKAPRRSVGLGEALVIAQVAVSLVLLIGAALFARSLNNLRSQDLGYDRDHLLLVWTVPGQTGRMGLRFAALAEEVQERLSRVAGVRSVSPSSSGLLNGFDGNLSGGTGAVAVEGQAPRDGLHVFRSVVLPGFFETTGIRLMDGRDFSAYDTESAPPVAIVNQTFARFIFGGQNAVGRHIGWLGDVGTPREIVAVVSDAKHNTLRDRTMGMIYLPHRQRPGDLSSMCVVVRTVGDPRAAAAAVRLELRRIDPSLPVLSIETVDDQLNVTLVKERLITALAEFFGTVTVLLACLGLYGVSAYAVARRTHEIGVRLALGATRRGVLTLVMVDSLLLVAGGIAIGIAATLASARLIAAQLFGLAPFDPLSTIAGTICLVLAVAALAAFLPARRASRIDPMVALRHE